PSASLTEAHSKLLLPSNDHKPKSAIKKIFMHNVKSSIPGPISICTSLQILLYSKEPDTLPENLDKKSPLLPTHHLVYPILKPGHITPSKT
ncbi:hypothetical protein, partial [Schleiferia thermophila]